MTAIGDGDAEQRIARLVDAHGAALMRVARHFSLCADDAHDAYQRALEIYLRRLASVDPATEGAWMRVVVRHEAMAVRRARSGSVDGEEVDFDARPANDARAPDERAESLERSARSAEALRRLKPDEARALLLKAEGHTYGEIAERNGWTYTKVNRAITEGRRRFLRTYEELERGDACEAFAPTLAALAQGTATAESILALRPHLRHCPACRATIRELRGGRRRVAAWLPGLGWLAGVLGRGRESEPGGSGSAPGPPAEAGAALSWERNAVEAGGDPNLAPSDAALSRWAELKLRVQDLLHRFGGSDVATSAQIVAGSSGGRGVGLATLIGICLSSVGAGTYCVATLVLPDEPAPIERKAEKRPRDARPKPVRTAAREPVRLARPVIAEPTPEPNPRPRPRRRARAKASPPVARGGSTAHESAPPPAPAAQGQQELSFEQSAPQSAPVAPAPAPPTGGGEFAP